MMISEKRTANAVGGKTARACDGCLRKRARWYCVADDAFLCQGCDASVHSANQLASRHERVRLEAASASSCNYNNNNKLATDTAPVWHQGFTRKARTPRHHGNKAAAMGLVQHAKANQEPIVPEIGIEDQGSAMLQGDGYDDDQEMMITDELLHLVPVFDPTDESTDNFIVGGDYFHGVQDDEDHGTCDFDDLHGFLPSDIDLAEFAADVESFLGGGGAAADEDSCDVKALKVKDEEVELGHVAAAAAAACHHRFDWNFDYADDDDQSKAVMTRPEMEMKRTYVSLKLDYEAVITAWASQGCCPWTRGTRPVLNPNDCWPDCTGLCCKDVHHHRQTYGGGDGGREARVSRYREKRRTRLFSKKIRYEVRKLNAEKRPRMKGRFVKRTSFIGD